MILLRGRRIGGGEGLVPGEGSRGGPRISHWFSFCAYFSFGVESMMDGMDGVLVFIFHCSCLCICRCDCYLFVLLSLSFFIISFVSGCFCCSFSGAVCVRDVMFACCEWETPRFGMSKLFKIYDFLYMVLKCGKWTTSLTSEI